MATKTKTQKQPKRNRSRSGDETKRLSALDAAARVLGEAKESMSCPALIEAMAAKGYWKSPAGQTPAATLYAAIKREIGLKKTESRFKQSAPGRFELASM
jgi:HB1, ASXL, restriction endonuclease HTH domain